MEEKENQIRVSLSAICVALDADSALDKADFFALTTGTRTLKRRLMLCSLDDEASSIRARIRVSILSQICRKN